MVERELRVARRQGGGVGEGRLGRVELAGRGQRLAEVRPRPGVARRQFGGPAECHDGLLDRPGLGQRGPECAVQGRVVRPVRNRRPKVRRHRFALPAQQVAQIQRRMPRSRVCRGDRGQRRGAAFDVARARPAQRMQQRGGRHRCPRCGGVPRCGEPASLEVAERGADCRGRCHVALHQTPSHPTDAASWSGERPRRSTRVRGDCARITVRLATPEMAANSRRGSRFVKSINEALSYAKQAK